MEGREARALMKNKIEKRCNYFVFWFAKTLVFLPEISFSLFCFCSSDNSFVRRR